MQRLASFHKDTFCNDMPPPRGTCLLPQRLAPHKDMPHAITLLLQKGHDPSHDPAAMCILQQAHTPTHMDPPTSIKTCPFHKGTHLQQGHTLSRCHASLNRTCSLSSCSATSIKDKPLPQTYAQSQKDMPTLRRTSYSYKSMPPPTSTHPRPHASSNKDRVPYHKEMLPIMMYPLPERHASSLRDMTPHTRIHPLLQ